MLTKHEIARMIDHTILKADARKEDFDKIINECKENHFKMIAINSYPVAYCKERLQGTDTHVGAAIAFPLGQMTIEAKLSECLDAIQMGCDEIDYVINISELKNGNDAYIEEEMRRMVALCREHQVIIKVIFENCYLTQTEKIKLCEIALKVKPDFIKTSTGFGTSGATVEDVKLMKSIVKEVVEVKAAGGIRDLDTLLLMVEAGASRIGTSSGVKILAERDKK